MIANPLDRVGGLDTLAFEEVPDGSRESRVGQEVSAVGRLCVEAAELLVLAAGTGLEAGETVADAVIDRCVVADVEVQVPHVAQSAPVAPVECVALGDVEGARDWLAVLERDDEDEPVTEAVADRLEELVVQVLPSPGAVLDGREIEVVHG